jgi:ferredoxin-NADP reductase
MKLILAHKTDIAENTKAIWFEPEKPVRFTPGQFGDFTLTEPPFTDAKGNTRTFSFASAPGHDRIMIATRMRDSAFKRSLVALPIGTHVQLMGPMGSFTLDKDPARPAVFLTGGIGITPVRSIVEHATRQQMSHRIFVIYSNRTTARMAFFDDFRAWSRENLNLSFIPTLTEEAPTDWRFEVGKIDQRMLSGYIADLHAPIYYVVGPPAMVAAMKALLKEIDVDEMQIRTEDFVGY